MPATELDFAYALLDLGRPQALDPLLAQALDLALLTTGSQRGYLEVRGAGPEPRTWHIARALTDQALADVRSRVSTGIVAATLAEGRTVRTTQATRDPRFQDQRSVQEHQIEAVLCAPIGAPPFGVVYLQGRARPGPFDDEDQRRAELFARQLGLLADRLLQRLAAPTAPDPTAPWRARLRGALPLGRSPALASLLKEITLVAPLELDLLLTGPTGSGKSLIAELVAQNSPRPRLVTVNCAAIPTELLESELFGAERGAHSTATRATRGKVGAAQGGTLFLDEVAELPLPAQAKLLRLLQARRYHPLGAAREQEADIRVIAATHQDLEALVRERRFREDLLYRLQVYSVHCPGLDARREDIPLLLEASLREACERHGFPPLELAASTARAARQAEWPGHVRQLRNAAQRAAVRAHGEGSRQVLTRHLAPGGAPSTAAEPEAETWREATRRFQRELLSRVLEEEGGNVSAAARRLELARSYVYTLIEELDLR